MSQNPQKYVIRYTHGKKSSQVEEFDFSKPDLSIGRDINNDIQFDPETELVVSREHGKIIKKADDCFIIVDNGSRNGTFVNGKKVTGNVLLNPGDEIRLGVNGPAFVFDLNPRPKGFVQPTQLVKIPSPTNIIDIKAEPVKPSRKMPAKLMYWLAAPVLLLLAGAIVLWKGNTAKTVTAKMQGAGEMEVKIFPMQAVMPAAYKVYSNPMALDGRYFFSKILIDNKGTGDLKNVKVEYAIPGYIGWTTASEVKHILPNGSAVVTIYPQFPQKITEKTTESTERAQIRISYLSDNKPEKYEKTYAFEMLSRNDFLYTNVAASEVRGAADMEDNNDLAPVFVTPQDPIVKYYAQQIQEKLLGGETAAVGGGDREAIRVMMGMYEATRRSHMVYSATNGIWGQIGDIASTQQKIRLPREVITGNTGLCIEMSFLYASVFAAAGLEPVIFFKPGHAFPGIRYNGNLYAIEATAVGGEGLGSISTPMQAFETGMKEVQDFIKNVQAGDPRYTLIDVNALNKRGVQQMELSDDAFLRTKVDEIAAKFAAGGPFVFANQEQKVQNGQQVQQ
ncbi:MAG TPA: FHA domain-containing protein [Parafilimonas sp.]|nr:FHA domain-containing protein [Parafilimonas sp.]